MAGHGFVMFGWSRIEASVLDSQVFGQASMEGCDPWIIVYLENSLYLCFAHDISSCYNR